jgi:hypothetical protein
VAGADADQGVSRRSWDRLVQITTADDLLNRHDLSDEEWERLMPLLPGIRDRVAGEMITGR